MIEIPLSFPALEAELDAKAAGGRLAVVAVNRRTGEPVSDRPLTPAQIERPSDLAGDLALVFSLDQRFQLASTARLGFDFHWIREVALGRITGDLGLELDAGAEAALSLTLAARLLGVVSLDEQRWLRLRLFKRSGRGFDCALGISAAAQPRTPQPRLEELVWAILGVHELQWLEEVARNARSDGALARFFEHWSRLGSRAAAAIWRLAGDESQLGTVRDWVHRIATELRGQPAFRAALEEAIESAPGFAGSPAGRWIEAAAGGLLSAVASLPQFEKLLAAAEAADKLLSQPSLLDSLAQLKQRAVENRGQPNAPAARGTGPADASGKLWNLANQVYQKALSVLAGKYSTELSFRYESADAATALLDCAFDFSDEGLRAYREAIGGDLSRLPVETGHIRLRQGLFTHGLRRQAQVELHLPFLDRKQWLARTEALARARVESTGDGRVFVYTVEASDQLQRRSLYQSTLALSGAVTLGRGCPDAQFTLAYTDRRRLLPAQVRLVLTPALRCYGFGAKVEQWLESALAGAEAVEAALTLAVPGEMVRAWLDAPGERSRNYGSVYTAVSVAVQQAMRKWLPYVYFNDLSRYDCLGAAYPLVVYQCTIPFRSKAKNQFAYDVMSLENTAVARRSTGWALAAELERVEQLLIAAGRRDTARFYKPARKSTILASVERQPRLLNALLVADALFIDQLIRLGVRASGLRGEFARNPVKATSGLARFADDFVSAFHRKLRRLYGGQDFVPFGSLMLVEATGALNAAPKEKASVAGTLRLSLSRKGSAERLEQTFVNSGFRA